MIKEILLVLVLNMADDQPDIQTALKVDTIEHCWQQAADFIKTPLPKYKGAVGLTAGCTILYESEGEDSE